MQKKAIRIGNGSLICSFPILLLVLVVSSAFAGTTGTIAGQVRDTSEAPVIGASVMIEDTPLGAVTDANGEYFIHGLIPGSYTVTARMVGKSDFTKEGVSVVADQITRIDFVLDSEAVGWTVVQVTDQRNLILQDVPSTIVVIDAEEINTMPVAGVLDLVDRQAGIISRGGGIHVRGGRVGEVAFLLDGIPLRSPITNVFVVSIPLAAISEASVITGGFGSEYGNAMSGIVNLVSMEGGDEYSGTMRYRGGDFISLRGEESSSGYETPSENDNFRNNCTNVTASIGGPEPLTEVLLPAIGIDVPGEASFFAAGEWQKSGYNFLDSRDYWENNWLNDWSGMARLTYRPTLRTGISFSAYYTYREMGWDEWIWSRLDQVEYIGATPYLGENPDYALPVRFNEILGITGSLTQMLGEESILEVKVNQTEFDHWRRIRTEEGGYVGEGYDPFDWLAFFTPGERVADSLGFYHTGMHQNVWLESRSTVATGIVDLTAMLNPRHQMKFGIEGRYYDIYDYSVYAEDVASIIVGQWDAYPSAGGAYVQSKANFSGGMVMNLGARFDWFNPNCSEFDAEEGREVDVAPKYQISPRFGITHPVTENDVFFATYGHYFQMPSLNQMFMETDYNISGAYSLVGNPNLEPERTIGYEAGLRHLFDDLTTIAFSAFYKDMTGLVRAAENFNEEYNYYYLYENEDSHGTAKGIEVTLSRRPGGILSGNVSYSFSLVKGRYSSPDEQYEYYIEGYTLSPTKDNYLDWDQRHNASAHIDLSFQQGDGPVLGGIRILEGATAGVDWTWGSGFPYSPPSGGSALPLINTERYPATMRTDLRLSRKVWLGQITLRGEFTIFNLFNRKNIERIYDTGLYEESGYPGGDMNNPAAWSPARHILFGLSLEW